MMKKLLSTLALIGGGDVRARRCAGARGSANYPLDRAPDTRGQLSRPCNTAPNCL